MCDAVEKQNCSLRVSMRNILFQMLQTMYGLLNALCHPDAHKLCAVTQDRMHAVISRKHKASAIKLLVLQYWAKCIVTAEAPNPLSSRDGRLLKPVPKQDRLAQPELIQKLQEAGKKTHDLQTKLLCQAWSMGKKPDKAVLALMRGFAYAHAGRHTQALKVSKHTRSVGSINTTFADQCLI